MWNNLYPEPIILNKLFQRSWYDKKEVKCFFHKMIIEHKTVINIFGKILVKVKQDLLNEKEKNI